jgi:hypothetical protein
MTLVRHSFSRGNPASFAAVSDSSVLRLPPFCCDAAWRRPLGVSGTTPATEAEVDADNVVHRPGAGVGRVAFSNTSKDVVWTDGGMPEATGWGAARAVTLRIPCLLFALWCEWGGGAHAAESIRGFAGRVLGRRFRAEESQAVLYGLMATECSPSSMASVCVVPWTGLPPRRDHPDPRLGMAPRRYAW